ncbi:MULTISPECIES: hypothetical protein [Pseudomonas]|uniref:hypothetical protein n=1 Tax=Pseudomonas TaxID=286 RepID=UPI0015E462C3|nr:MULTISPECIES: hypothetical protein [Pseudomonas]MBA1244081.1 hypothetical protein [Pseudomonas japonica]MBA1288206.1 hypothetical protein [Pseudomonas japonica]
MKMQWCVVFGVIMLAGCTTTHEQLLQQGYPPGFADGYQDGCGSGRGAAGSITGTYTKNVPRYLSDKLYSSGWDDGFRQCQAALANQERQDLHDKVLNDRDRDWQRDVDNGKARAYHSN